MLDALSYYLKPLQRYLDMPDLVELSVSNSSQVGLEIAGHGYQFVETPELTEGYWLRLCRVLANLKGTYFDEQDQPILSAELPGGHRFQAMIGRHVKNRLMITIRVRRKLKVGLDQFGVSGPIKEDIINVIKACGVILISGGMSSGKTTLFNALLSHIPQEARIQCVEDAFELDIPHHNKDNYFVDRNDASQSVNYTRIIEHITRARPDFILTGEVSVENAFSVVRLLNLGHGFMATVHANTPKLCFDAISQNIAMSGIQGFDVKPVLSSTIDRVIQIAKIKDEDSEKRQVVEVFAPKENYSWVKATAIEWKRINHELV